MSVPFTLFVDRSLGRHKVARALRDAGAVVEIHDDHFAQDAPDEEWLVGVAERGWIMLTKDAKIGYRPLELLAVKNSQARVYCLVSQNMPGPGMAEAFVAALNGILRHAETNDAPYIAKVYRDGSVSTWKSASDL